MPGREPCWPGAYCYLDGEIYNIEEMYMFENEP